MDPVSIAAVGWGLTATGWLVSPYIGRLLDRALAHIKPSKSRDNICKLVNRIVPQLKLILEAAEDNQHKDLFEELLTELKHAFYDTEDILSEIEYIRRQGNPSKRKLDSSAGDGPSNQTTALKKSERGKTSVFDRISRSTSLSQTTTQTKSMRGKSSVFERLSRSTLQNKASHDVDGLSSLTITELIDGDLKKNLAKIEDLIERAEKIIKMSKLGTDENSYEHAQNNLVNKGHRTMTSDTTGNVTGREKTIVEIQGMLYQKENDQLLSVIGIIGLPGSGKTTLAQCVYKSERKGNHFDLVMWIHVSKDFTLKDIYNEMLEQAWKEFGNPNKNCPKYDSLQLVKDELQEVLNGKLLLLVLDDIWFSKKETAIEQNLQNLFIPLEGVKRESKILLTSREDSLLRLGTKVKSTVYKIPVLPDDVFLKLFMEYALDDKRVSKEVKESLHRIGAKIAQKLMKLPLLARVVGSNLFQKQKIEERDWINVQNQNLLDKYMGALWWSYHHLDEQARRCFAYCSVFPRRYHLRRDDLVNLWVAEGFINTTNEGLEMEAVGRECFDKLLSSSFLLPGGINYEGEEFFLIHDLLYDLAVKVAGDDCFTIETCWNQKISPNVRHLSIQSCSASIITHHVVKLKKLRTLIIYNGEHDINLDSMCRKLSKHLRVLIFRRDNFFEIGSTGDNISLPSIESLKLLRYLGIATWGKKTLPRTLDKLYLLQVLDVGHFGDTDFSSGEDSYKLVDLRHITGYIPNIGGLTSLQTMPAFDVGIRDKGYEMHQLKLLNKLQGKLKIIGLECVETKEEAIEAKLADKEQLTELSLHWDTEWTDDCNPDLQADVLEVLCPPYIKDLTICGYNGSRYPSWMVGREKSAITLHNLSLENCSQPICQPGLFFISVCSLVLECCPWKTLPYNMDRLTSLELMACWPVPNLEHLTSLRELIIRSDPTNDCYHDISWTLPTLPESLEYIEIEACNIRGRLNWNKIKDIPQKNIDGSAFNDINDEEFEDPPARALRRREWLEFRSVVDAV